MLKDVQGQSKAAKRSKERQDRKAKKLAVVPEGSAVEPEGSVVGPVVKEGPFMVRCHNDEQCKTGETKWLRAQCFGYVCRYLSCFGLGIGSCDRSCDRSCV